MFIFHLWGLFHLINDCHTILLLLVLKSDKSVELRALLTFMKI